MQFAPNPQHHDARFDLYKGQLLSVGCWHQAHAAARVFKGERVGLRCCVFVFHGSHGRAYLGIAPSPNWPDQDIHHKGLSDMNPLDALRMMVDAYPGGREAVALRRGKSPEVLRKELAGAPGFKLGVVDAAAIASMCTEVGSEYADAYAQSVAAQCGTQLVALPASSDTGADLVQRASVMVKESAEVMGSVASALSDGAISVNDMKTIEKEAAEASAAILSVLRAARAAHQRTVEARP